VITCTGTAIDSSLATDSSGQLSFEVSNGSDVVMDASLAFENTSATNAINYKTTVLGSTAWSVRCPKFGPL